MNLIWGWITMTLNTSMRDLSFLQWLFVVGIVVSVVWGGLLLSDLCDRMRK